MTHQPIHYSAENGHLKSMEELLNDSNIEAKGEGGRTPLILASYHGRVEMVKYLVEKGANVEATDKHGNTPLLVAGYWGRSLDMVKYLVEQAGADVKAVNYEGKTALEIAKNNGRSDVVKYLRRKGFVSKLFGRSKPKQQPAYISEFTGEDQSETEEEEEQQEQKLLKKQRQQQKHKEQGLLVEGRQQQEQKHKPQEMFKKQQHQEDVQQDLERLRLDLDRQRKEFEQQQQQQKLDQREEESKRPTKKQDQPQDIYNNLKHLREDLDQQRKEFEQMKEEEMQNQELPYSICSVFLSHTGVDDNAATFAAFLGSSLKYKYDVDCFLDSETLKTGDSWKKKIEDNAKGCKVFVAIMSEHYFQRYWCLRELDLAMNNGCIIIPVFFGENAKIPKAHDLLHDQSFASQVHQLLSEKELQEDSETVSNRWLANIAQLDTIQGCRNTSYHKHWMSHYCDEVANQVYQRLDC